MKVKRFRIFLISILSIIYNLLFRAKHKPFNLLFRALSAIFNLLFRVGNAILITRGDLMLKRKIYDDLLKWKNNSKGSSALMIDGARRVGKSYIVNKFSQEQYKSYIIIDFGNAPKDILDVFEYDSYNLDLFFAKISAFYSTVLYRRESIIVFDEVQQFPKARQLIKYLVADGRYDYIETGSLIRLKKKCSRYCHTIRRRSY